MRTHAMSPLADFLRRLFREGRVVFQGRPEPRRADRGAALGLLRQAHDDDALDLAGPPAAFDPGAALAAAEFLRQAAWYLIRRDEPAEAMEPRLALADPPAQAGAGMHLSADLTLRHLPQLHRRAQAMAPGDRLAARMAEVLRAWPLSGVLSDLEDGPATPPDFGGHAGATIRYVERWARVERPAWLPGPDAAEVLELVLDSLGRGQRAAAWIDRMRQPTADVAEPAGAAIGEDDGD